MASELKESKAMKEVWAWKDACYREVAHLPLEAALLKRIKDSKKTMESLGVHLPMASSPRSVMVAEPSTKYKARRKKK